MIQLKATCLRCGGTGYNRLDTSASDFLPPLLCPDCDGKGILVLTSENWDIDLERVPPFSLEEMQEMRKK
jgi:DnaJ-class molecular chaperone